MYLDLKENILYSPTGGWKQAGRQAGSESTNHTTRGGSTKPRNFYVFDLR